jgi:hypothetical protein
MYVVVKELFLKYASGSREGARESSSFKMLKRNFAFKNMFLKHSVVCFSL